MEETSVRIGAAEIVSDAYTCYLFCHTPSILLSYARLEDNNTVVRKNALMVVSHLVLNDMIKLSGHAHTLAKRLEDSDTRIADFAKLFFSEFHQKGDNNLYVSHFNAVGCCGCVRLCDLSMQYLLVSRYNILVDAVSCLAQESELEAPQIQRIMKYLCDFVTKDWQIANLVRFTPPD